MALKPCRECGVNVSTEAQSCPKCGVPSPTGKSPPRGASARQSLGFYDAFVNVIRWVVIICVGISVIWWVNLPKSPEQKAANEQATAIAQRAIASAQKSTWETVEVTNATDHSYDLTLWYRSKPDSYPAIEADTRLLIRAVLIELKNNGMVLSADNMMRITVFAHQHVFGETGQPLVRNFGRVRYNSIGDKIEFIPP